MEFPLTRKFQLCRSWLHLWQPKLKDTRGVCLLAFLSFGGLDVDGMFSRALNHPYFFWEVDDPRTIVVLALVCLSICLVRLKICLWVSCDQVFYLPERFWTRWEWNYCVGMACVHTNTHNFKSYQSLDWCLKATNSGPYQVSQRLRSSEYPASGAPKRCIDLILLSELIGSLLATPMDFHTHRQKWCMFSWWLDFWRWCFLRLDCWKGNRWHVLFHILVLIGNL